MLNADSNCTYINKDEIANRVKNKKYNKRVVKSRASPSAIPAGS